MPVVYTFPSTIYVAPVLNVPFTNDEIECTIEGPTNNSGAEGLPAHPNAWRALFRLTVNYQANGKSGLSNVTVGVTVPRDSCSNPFHGPKPSTAAPLPPPVTTNLVAGNATTSWTFASAPLGTYVFAVDFAPPFPTGTELTATFDIKAAEVNPPVSLHMNFVKTT